MDDQCIAILHQGCRLPGNRLLGRYPQHLVLGEGPGRYPLQCPGLGGGDAAEHLAHRTRGVKLADITPDGGGRGVDHRLQVPYGGEGPVPQEVQHQLVALGFGHGQPHRV